MRSWPERLAAAGDAVWFYLGKLLWPHPLITVYPRWQIDAGKWVSYLPLLAVIVVLFVLWLKRESWSRPWFFIFAYFLVALLPVLSLIDNPIFRYSLVFDHFQYLASMGPLALAGAGIIRLADIVIPGRLWLQASFCAGLLLLLGALSWQRAWVFESEETLWSDTLAKNPNCWVGHNGLGVALAQKQQPEEAIRQFNEAARAQPNYVDAFFNRGHLEYLQGNLNQSEADFEQAGALVPDNPQPYLMRGVIKQRQGDFPSALANYRRFRALAPEDPVADNAMLYIWIIDNEQNQKSEADQELSSAMEKNWNAASGDWVSQTGRFLLGQINETDYLTAAASTDKSKDQGQHCEAWYFVGMKRLLAGDKNAAAAGFRASLATGKTDFFEYGFAQAQLNALPAR